MMATPDTYATLAELSRCLSYPRLRPYIHIDDEALAQWIDHFAIASPVVEDEAPLDPPIVQDDPDDDVYCPGARCLAHPTAVSALSPSRRLTRNMTLDPEWHHGIGCQVLPSASTWIAVPSG